MSLHNTKKWKHKTQVVKRRDGYECRECRKYGRSVDGVLVHHVYPADDYPDLFYNTNNLITLCYSCHELMHDRSLKSITELGKQWQRKLENEIFRK